MPLLDILKANRPGRGDAPEAIAHDFTRVVSQRLLQRLRLELRVLPMIDQMLSMPSATWGIYGSAEVGQIIARYARQAGIEIRCFVETTPCVGNQRVLDLEVLDLAKALAAGVEAFAVGTVNRIEEIVEILRTAQRNHQGRTLKVVTPPIAGSLAGEPVGPALAESFESLKTTIHLIECHEPRLLGTLFLELLPTGKEHLQPSARELSSPSAWPDSPLDPRLLKPARPLSAANLQFTGDCNLKCVYCGHSSSQWPGTRMSADLVSEVMDFILQDRTEHVMVGFFGEATLFPGWEKLCERLLDAGLALSTNSNFLRLLRPEEIAVLSRFTEVAMSIDSVDLALQKRLRPPMDARNLVHALHQIRSKALLEGRKGPRFVWTGVLTPDMVPRLEELVAYAHSCGIRHLSMNELTPVLEAPEHACIYDAPDHAFLDYVEHFQRAASLASSLGMILTLPEKQIAEHLRIVQARLSGGSAEEPSKVRMPVFHGTAECRIKPIPEGMVGYCLAPWTHTYIMPTGEVFPCCIQAWSMGRIDATTPLSSVLESAEYKAIRSSLLTGRNLHPTCRHCPLMDRFVDPAELRSAVAELLGLEDSDAASRS